MLIMTQNRKNLLNLESLGSMFLSSCYGDYDGGPVKILASYPLAEDVTEVLGEYESEDRATKVLDEIAKLYEKHTRTSQRSALVFAFEPPKVYRMPEK